MKEKDKFDNYKKYENFYVLSFVKDGFLYYEIFTLNKKFVMQLKFLEKAKHSVTFRGDKIYVQHNVVDAYDKNTIYVKKQVFDLQGKCIRDERDTTSPENL